MYDTYIHISLKTCSSPLDPSSIIYIVTYMPQVMSNNNTREAAERNRRAHPLAASYD